MPKKKTKKSKSKAARRATKSRSALATGIKATFALLALYVSLCMNSSMQEMSTSIGQAFSQSSVNTEFAEPRGRNLPPSWPEADILDNVAVDGTIVVFIATCPYIDFLENVLSSLDNIGITNYVIVPMDKLTWKRVKQIWPDHTVSVPPIRKSKVVGKKFQDAARFGSEEFKKITAPRPLILKAFLKSSGNYNILYSDTDTFWRSPDTIKRFQEVQSQHPESKLIGVSEVADLSEGLLCSGLIYMPRAKKANLSENADDVNIVQFMTIWDNAMQTGKHLHDQDAIQDAHRQILANRPNGEAFVHMLLNDDPYFPVGQQYFEIFNSQQREGAYVVHNNWIIGKPAKLERFIKFSLWNKPTKVYALPNREECGI